MVLLDTGPVLAAIRSDDPLHQCCAEALSAYRDRLLVPCTVLEEVSYFVGRIMGTREEAGFADSIAKGEFDVEHLEPSDWARVHELLTDYEDLRLGSVDASLIAVAERLGVTQIMTLDRRHFSVVRPRHCRAFEILP